jgi:Uma2 family endonuclease
MPRTKAKARGASIDTAVVMPQWRLFTADEYDRMIEAGILHEDEHVELLDGEILQMAAMGSSHAGCVTFLTRWFITRMNERATVIVQSPIRLSDGSEPEPDLALLLPRADDYRKALALPNDVLLLIEVADMLLAYDRDRKLPRYAEAGIPEVWIVDLTSNTVLSHRGPSPDGYQSVATLGRGETLSPAAFPDLFLPIAELLP